MHFLIGVFTHGYGRYDIIRDDPSLCFGKRIAEAKRDCAIEEPSGGEVMKMKIDNDEEGDGEAMIEGGVEDGVPMDVSVDKDISYQSETAARGSVEEGAVPASQDAVVMRDIDDEVEVDAEVEGYREEKEDRKRYRDGDRDRDRERKRKMKKRMKNQLMMK